MTTNLELTDEMKKKIDAWWDKSLAQYNARKSFQEYKQRHVH